MNDIVIVTLLEDAGAVLRNSHFRYASGKHGPDYVSKEIAISKTDIAEIIAREMATDCYDLPVQTVVGPVVGGAILAQMVASNLNIVRKTPTEVRFAWADKAAVGGFEFRGILQDLIVDRDILVVEDVLNTGGSVAETIAAVRALGGRVPAVCAMVNRGGVTAEKLGVPELFSLVDVSMAAYDPAECPLCKQGVPMRTDVGHGKKAA